VWLEVRTGRGIAMSTSAHAETKESHPDLAVIDRPLILGRLLLRLSYRVLPRLLFGAVTAVETAGGRTKHAVMAGIVTGDAADHRALQAALGVGAAGRKRQRRDSEQSGNGLHGSDPHEIQGSHFLC
jgi:hypothetical protein